MHIGIDIRVLATGRMSGVEEYARNLLMHMVDVDRSIRFSLVSFGRRAPGWESWMSAPNVHVQHVYGSSRLATASMCAFGRPRMDVLAGRPTVFFFPHFLYGALSRDCRRVMTFHDLSYERFPEFFTLRQRLWHTLHMRPRAQARTADHIIAVSDATAHDLTERYGVSPDSVSVIPSGIDDGFRHLSDGELMPFRRYHDLPKRFVLSMCTREPRKNLLGLVRAFERMATRPGLQDVELVIAGPSGWLERDFIRAIRRSPVRERIRCIGPVPPRDRVSWYNAAALLAYPSYFEGFGFPPLEAMACGTPVVTSHASSLPEVVGSAGVLVDPYDIGTLSLAMARVLEEPAFAAHLSRKGMERSSRFTWVRAAERTLGTLVHTPR